MSTTKSSKINSRTHNGIVFMLIGMIISTISWAETVKTVNGTDIDSLVLDIYIQSRTQQAATEATPDQMARDVVTFLAWAAEPHLEARHKTGTKVMIYLILLATLVYFSMKRLWSRIDAEK